MLIINNVRRGAAQVLKGSTPLLQAVSKNPVQYRSSTFFAHQIVLSAANPVSVSTQRLVVPVNARLFSSMSPPSFEVEQEEEQTVSKPEQRKFRALSPELIEQIKAEFAVSAQHIVTTNR